MREITELMNAYRECSRNLWNVYFSGRTNIGASLDGFGQIRHSLFDALVVSELSYEVGNEKEDIDYLLLKIEPRAKSVILIQRFSDDGNGYWDQERDMVVGPDDIELEFIDYFDFSQIPVMDFRYFRCKILRYPGRPNYAGREALIDAADCRVFHDE